jgi:uncharacterized protein
MKLLKNIAIVLGILYTIICVGLYFVQEKLLFIPTKLGESHLFEFSIPYQEQNIPTLDGEKLNTVWFKADSAKAKNKVIFYLHGNGGCVADWGEGAPFFTENGYDILYLDYRSYGKSTGSITSEKQLLDDAQLVYDFLKTQYTEANITLVATSIGTGMAAHLATKNQPAQLILNAPYYSLLRLAQEKVSFVPSFIVKYQLKTNEKIADIKCPITVFHGEQDELIPVQHSLDLKQDHPKINLFTVPNAGHNDVTHTPLCIAKMKELLR